MRDVFWILFQKGKNLSSKYLVFSKHDPSILLFTSKGFSLVDLTLHYQEYIITTLCCFYEGLVTMDCKEILQVVQKFLYSTLYFKGGFL